MSSVQKSIVWIKKEGQRLLQVRDHSEFFEIAFRLNQAFTILGFLWLLIVLLPNFSLLTGHGGFGFSAFSIIGSSIFWTGLIVLISEICLRKIRQKDFLGILLGTFVFLITLPSTFFFIGLFGLYSLYNPGFQKKYFENPPAFVESVLETLNLNYTKS